MKNLLLIMTTMCLLVMTACEKEENVLESADAQQEIDSRTPPNAVPICHLKEDGTYVLKNVPPNSIAGHLSHGDKLPDVDGDGYTYTGACTGSANDCNDNDPNVHPGATETCDSIDNDCDGLVDSHDPDVTGQSWWTRDLDGDGYGDPSYFTQWCTQPEGYVNFLLMDCDDEDPNVYTGAYDIPNDGIDQDCSGTDSVTVIVYPPCDCFTMQDLQDLYDDQPWPFGWYSDVPGSCKDVPYDQLMEVWLTNIGQPTKNYNFSAQAGTINGNPFASMAKFNHLTGQFDELCGGYTNAQNASNCAQILHDFIAQMRSTHPTWDYCVRFP